MPTWTSTGVNGIEIYDQVWKSWYVSTNTSTAVTYNLDAQYVWDNWTNQYYTIRDAYEVERRAQLRPPAGEHVDRLREQRRLVREQEEERRVTREKANARAQELLLLTLSQEERAHFEEHKELRITGSSGTVWIVRVNSGYSGNVCKLNDQGDEVLRICAHASEYVGDDFTKLPKWDQFAAQVLALKADDEAFEQIANVHWRRPPTTEELRETEEQIMAEAERRGLVIQAA